MRRTSGHREPREVTSGSEECEATIGLKRGSMSRPCTCTLECTEHVLQGLRISRTSLGKLAECGEEQHRGTFVVETCHRLRAECDWRTAIGPLYGRRVPKKQTTAGCVDPDITPVVQACHTTIAAETACHPCAPATMSDLEGHGPVLAFAKEHLIPDDQGPVLLFKRKRLGNQLSASHYLWVPQESAKTSVAHSDPLWARQRFDNTTGAIKTEGHLVAPVSMALRLQLLGTLNGHGHPHLVTCPNWNAQSASQSGAARRGRWGHCAWSEAVDDDAFKKLSAKLGGTWWLPVR